MAVRRIILDTDIGSDIDDAVALAWLLARNDCEIVGITTVAGEPQRRAAIASAMCRVAGRDIPIYPGVALPMQGEQRQPRATQAEALAQWPHETAFPAGEAIEFIRRAVRAAPGEITLLSIGPLTNIAYLLSIDPEVAGMFADVVSMVGTFDRLAFGGRTQEWNAFCDPLAIDTVLRAPIPSHRIVPLDVTEQLSLSSAEVRQRFGHKLLQPVLSFAESWFARTDRIVFHDPLAAVLLFHPEICTWHRGTVDCDLLPRQAGRTIWRPGAEPQRHVVAFEVDAPAFFEHYFSPFERA